MAPFKFPPPPPPPPSKVSNDAPTSYGSQRGGSSGRGDRGRGRGGAPRGRGHHQGSPRGGNQRGGHRGGQQHGGRGGSQYYGAQNNSYQQQQQQQHLPSYSNMNLASELQNPTLPNPSTNGVPPLDPGAFAHAMAFMATPAGMQTMAAFAANMASGHAAPAYGQPVPPTQSTPQNRSSHPQPSPRKRKRSERHEQWQAQQSPNQSHPHAQETPVENKSTQKPPRAKAKAPPPIPGFGFSLPPVPKPPVTSKTSSGHSQNHKRMNLGLTSLNYDKELSSEEEEDVDEEAALAAKWDGKGMIFEHNGETISLQTAAEFAEYIKDRKKNFPTQQRIAEKAQLAAEKRESELEFLRRVKGSSGRAKASEVSRPSDRGPKKHMEKRTDTSKPKLEELREKVKDSMLAKHRPAAPPSSTSQQAVDLGLGYGTDTESDNDSILSESSVVSSSDPSEDDESSPDADEAEDSDAAPEAQSSKIPAAPIRPPQLSRAPDHKTEDSSKDHPRVCKQWKATGKCKYKYCKYRHAEEETKRVGLYERLVEQELDKADRLALDAIKYLGRNGFLG